LIDKAEFEPRIIGLRQRMAQLSKQKHVAVEAADAERELSLVISQLEEFSARVTQSLGQLDWLGRREIIHTLVRRIEIDQDDVEIVFRVPPPAGASPAGPQGPSLGLAQHCTDVYARLRRAMGALAILRTRSARAAPLHTLRNASDAVKTNRRPDQLLLRASKSVPPPSGRRHPPAGDRGRGRT
jgi:hypothetical protein